MGLPHPPSPDRVSICRRTGKDILTKGEAKKVAKRTGRRRKGNRCYLVAVEAYRCDQCGGWHVGRKRPNYKRGGGS